MTKDQYGNEPFDYDSSDSARYDSRYDEPLDAEIVDEPADYRGAHRRDDDADYIEPDYDEGSDYVDGNYINAPVEETERRGSTAVAAGSGAGSGAAAGGLPRRGLAMILIAVAALLLLWALWAMTQKGGDNNAASSQTSTSTEVVAPSPSAAPADVQQQGEQGAAGQAGQAGTSDQAQDPNASQDPNAPASEAAPRDPNAQDGQDPNAQAPAPAAPAPQGAQLNSGNAEVFVYNNSGVADLASRTADQLQGQFRVANQSPDAATMNMPEQRYGVFPETYVFFDPATPGAEQVAAEIARRVGGTARAKDDIPEGATSLPEQAANNRNAVAVVLAG